MRSQLAYLILLFAMFLAGPLAAQLENEWTDSRVLGVQIIGDDTIPEVDLKPVTITEFRADRSKSYQRKWNRLMKRVVKVYPYARVAGELMNEYDRQLSELKTKKQRNEYLDMAEAELKREFEGEIRDMTVSEGFILIKLIDRETGNTSYELIKDLKSGFTAFMWQAVARLFGSDLKEQYDAEGEDQMIEEIVAMIEAGEIYVDHRKPKTPEARARVNKKKSKKKDS